MCGNLVVFLPVRIKLGKKTPPPSEKNSHLTRRELKKKGDSYLKTPLSYPILRDICCAASSRKGSFS